jgi:DNA mismatch repair protein MutS
MIQEINHYRIPITFDKTIIESMLEFISRQIIIENCYQVRKIDVETTTDEEGSDSEMGNSIIRPGVSVTLDELMREKEQCQKKLDEWQNVLNRLLNVKDNNYIKIHKTEKMGLSLQITKPRTKLLKEAFSKIGEITITVGSTSEIIPVKDIEFTSVSSSSNEIECPMLTKLCKRLFQLKDIIRQRTIQEYGIFLSLLERNHYSDIIQCMEYVGKIDMLCCKTYNVITYHLCCPEIVEGDSSFVQSENLRHPLIEQLLTNEMYVPNDISIGRGSGMLLFGINSSGKTSLLRSVGISIILAQTGNFVPATKFHYNYIRLH